MSALLLNEAAGHASHGLVDQKTARPHQVPVLVDHYHRAETETAHQQATGGIPKNTEHFAQYLLTISGVLSNQAAIRKTGEYFAH